MKVHLLDTEKKPSFRSIVRVNCGEKIEFRPIDAKFDDERTCQNCWRIHLSVSKIPSKHTFCIKK